MQVRKGCAMVTDGQKEPKAETSSTTSSEGTTDNPLVFISHDSRDADLAEEFANLLTDASGGIVKSFRSSDRKGTAGIEFGDEWYRAIMRKLDDATDVVALLTARSINRPWILYEAGVAKGKIASTVFGLALGVSLSDAVTGPFAQFQNSGDDEDSITKLVLQLIKRHPHADPREEAVRRQVRAFLEKLTNLLETREGEPPVAETTGDTSVAKLFEEVKVLVRDMPHRVAVEVSEDRPSRSRKRRRFHPMMVEEFLHGPMSEEDPEIGGIAILMLCSMFRDDLPWFYEMGADLYRSLCDGSPRAVDLARKRLMTAMEMMHRGPMMEFMEGPEDHEMFMVMRHMFSDLDRIVERSVRRRRGSKQDSG